MLLEFFELIVTMIVPVRTTTFMVLSSPGPGEVYLIFSSVMATVFRVVFLLLVVDFTLHVVTIIIMRYILISTIGSITRIMVIIF